MPQTTNSVPQSHHNKTSNRKDAKKANGKNINPTHVNIKPYCILLVLTRVSFFADHDNHVCVVLKVSEDMTIEWKK